MIPHAPTRLLPADVRNVDVAESCRYGALAFLNGTLAAWGKPELAAWLGGAYHSVTRFAREGLDVEARVSSLSASVSASASSTAPLPSGGIPSNARKVAPYAIERVMKEAHDEVLDTMRLLSEPDGGVSFAFAALGGVLVARCKDTDGDFGWIPVAPTRMRLADRVLSLIAVDYLARPEDYEERLAICSTCSVISFDAAARSRRLCRVHSGSGIRFKEGAERDSAIPPSTLPGPSREPIRGAG
jgi:hypothetical protein